MSKQKGKGKGNKAVTPTNVNNLERKQGIARLPEAKAESGFQQRLEMMQLALKNGQFADDNRTKRANRVFAAIVKRDQSMKNAGIPSIANYGLLLTIYKDDLAAINDKDLAKEAEIQIARFMGKTRGIITPEQKDVIIKYYHGKVTKVSDDVRDIARLLTEKGLLTGKEAVKLPTAKELAEATARKKEETKPVTNPVVTQPVAEKEPAKVPADLAA